MGVKLVTRSLVPPPTFPGSRLVVNVLADNFENAREPFGVWGAIQIQIDEPGGWLRGISHCRGRGGRCKQYGGVRRQRIVHRDMRYERRCIEAP